MRKTKMLAAVSALAVSVLGAVAANAATLTVGHYDGTTWTNDQSIVVVNGNAVTANGSNISLETGSGPAGPEMIYAISVINGSAQAQTYGFSFGEAISAPIGGAITTYADLAASLTTRSGNLGSLLPVVGNSIQRFELSSDGGLTFVDAGVDVGPGTSFSRTSAYGVFSATNPLGPAGQTWNYMRLVSSFTLSGNSAASFTGFASISPVPEPGVGGMMLLGIGLIGTIARRRRMWV